MSGTIESVSTLLTQFADGQAQGSIVPADVRNIIASAQAGTLETARIVTTNGSFSTLASDSLVLVAQASPAAITITLAAAPVLSQKITIIDANGVAASYPMTVVPSTGNINGASSFEINWAYGSVTFVFNGTNYNIV